MRPFLMFACHAYLEQKLERVKLFLFVVRSFVCCVHEQGITSRPRKTINAVIKA